MSRKTLYLHAGIHKTGSTSLQGGMNLSREILNEAGVHYLDAGTVNGAHQALADALADTPPRSGVPKVWEEALEEIRGRAESTLVVSSENFDRLNAAQVRRLRRILDGRLGDVDVQVIIYVRPQVMLLVSQHNQQVKEGFVRISRSEFLRRAMVNRPPWVRLRGLLRPWFRQFGERRLHVRVAEPAHLADGSVRSDFFVLLGYPELAQHLRGPSWRNASLNSEALEGIRDVLQLERFWALPFSERQPLLIRYYQTLQKTHLRRLDPDMPSVFGRALPSGDTIADCRKAFAADNRWLAKRFWGGRNRMDECYAGLLEGAATSADYEPGAEDRTREWVSSGLLAHLREHGYGPLLDGEETVQSGSR